ncbi:MAG: hypothetical protein R3E87_01105 [Burkholderiaceae bacterium]
MNPIPVNPAMLSLFHAAPMRIYGDSCVLAFGALSAISELNWQTARVVMQESGQWMADWMSAEPGHRLLMAIAEVEPTGLKMQAYCGHVQRIVEESGTEFAKLFDKQVDMNERQMLESVEAMAADGPVGNQSLVRLMTPASKDTNASADAGLDSRA